MSDEEEEKFYEKYIKPNRGIFQRIKMKFFKSKRIKTIKDFDWLDQSFIIKMIALLFLLCCLQIIGSMIIDVYHWFYPPPPDSSQPIPYFVPLILLQGWRNCISRETEQ